MRSSPANWKHFVFYGEVVGFVLAWIVGLVMLTRSEPAESRLASADALANSQIGLHDTHSGGRGGEERLK